MMAFGAPPVTQPGHLLHTDGRADTRNADACQRKGCAYGKLAYNEYCSDRKIEAADSLFEEEAH
jgi:hypothetical protein